MLAQYCAMIFYCVAVIAQCLAAAFAMKLFFTAKAYRLASGALALAFSLMIGRRIAPLLHYYYHQYYNLLDAALALLISLLLLLGLVQIKKIISELDEKNFLLDRSSKLDALTQALSRAEVFCRAELEIERSLRGRKPVAFLMIDIDHFKDVNDRFGHPAGDVVLQNLAKYCQEELRANDAFGRVGGEEFFAVLPETSEALAYEVAERVRNKVASNVCAVAQDHPIFITVSIGIAVFDPVTNGQTQTDVVLRSSYKRADEAMYLAKSKGRNRTEC